MRSIIEVMGDDTIMYQSDYPHDQCAFPKSPDTVLGWTGLSNETLTQAVLRQRRALPPAARERPSAGRLPLVDADSDRPALAAVFDALPRRRSRRADAVPHARQLAGDAQRMGGDGMAAAQRVGHARAALRELIIMRVAQLTRTDVRVGGPPGRWRSSAASPTTQLAELHSLARQRAVLARASARCWR